MAMQVQRSLLQDFDFMKNGVHILTKYLPAFEIGGDFYDIIDLDDEKTAVVIGDVSGHGISAALLTAMLNMMIKTFAPRYFDPGEFLSRMNAEFCTIFESTDSQMYACMFYAVIDTVKKEICFANAGQALPIFVDCERGEAYDLDSFGTPVGLLKGSDYEKKIISYNDNDILFLHTDGLADNLYKNNEDDFYPRVKSMLVDMKDDVAPKTIVSTLLNVFYKHDVSPKMKYELDDVSIIVCKFGETAEADETESGGAAEAKDKAGEKAARQIQQGARNV
jgi:sigma-B regulation protein RsbU (phosphoserine phosphatase)